MSAGAMSSIEDVPKKLLQKNTSAPALMFEQSRMNFFSGSKGDLAIVIDPNMPIAVQYLTFHAVLTALGVWHNASKLRNLDEHVDVLALG